MKVMLTSQVKKRAALRPPLWVASTDHVFPPPSMAQRTTSLCVIQIKLAMLIRRVSNLPYHYSIYEMQARCQALSARQRPATCGFVKNFPRDYV
jgi:hypothetical protein